MLPKVSVPIYDLKLISNGKTIKYRPFTVKEEKLFLMAAEANDVESVTTTIRQVVNNCILDEINIDDLPLFDLEYMFLNLRAKSVGEIVNLKYKCNNDVTDEEGNSHKCNNLVQIDFNVMDIEKPVVDKELSKIQLTDNLGMIMKYPTFTVVEKYKDKEDAETSMEIIIDCIDCIYDEDNVYYSKDYKREELVEFVDSLQSKDLEKIKKFFDNIPVIHKKLDFKCNKCGYHEEIDVKGTESFFV